MLILAGFKRVVKKNRTVIILLSTVILISLLSFALGIIVTEHQEKGEIILNYE
jgi:hypothetical protein